MAGSFVCILLLSFPGNFPSRTLICGSGNASGLCHGLTQKRQETWSGSLMSAHSQLVDRSPRRPGIKAVSNTQAWGAGFLVLPAAQMGKRKPTTHSDTALPPPAPLLLPLMGGVSPSQNPHEGLGDSEKCPLHPLACPQQFLKGKQWQL